jgi:hypothetical protein
MYLRRILLFLFATALSISAGAALPPVPLQNNERVAVSVSDKTKLSPEAVKKAIVVGGASKGWRLAQESPGSVRLSINVRQHSATIDIGYSLDAYSIKYVSSENLDYAVRDGVETIHPTYNRWLRNLIQAITAELLRI